MRGKTLLWMSIAFALLSSLAMVNVGIAPATPSLQVEPSNFGNVSPGTLLYINVNIYDVVGLSAIEFTLRWDPYVLQCIYPPVGTTPDVAGPMAEGPFMPEQAGASGTVPTCYVSMLGERLLFGDAFLDPVTASGSGTVAVFVLEVIGSGSTAIELTGVSLYDFWLIPMKCNIGNGKVTAHNVGRVTETWPEASLFIISEQPDPINTLYASVTNYGVGVGTIYARVEFVGYDPVTGEARKYNNDEGLVPLDEGATVTLSSTGFDASAENPGRWEFHARCIWSYTLGGAAYRQDEKLVWAKPLKFQVRP